MLMLFLEQARGRPTWFLNAGDLVPAGTTLVTSKLCAYAHAHSFQRLPTRIYCAQTHYDVSMFSVGRI